MATKIKPKPKPKHKRMMLWISEDTYRKLKKIAGIKFSVQEAIRQIIENELTK